MNILEAAQGSPAWHQHRSTHFNASDAPAMMGLSPYKTRSEFIRELATGVTPDIDPATQRRFDDGHRFERLARPIAEKILGEDLFPVVGYEGMLSASFDGLTMDGSVCFEHKTINSVYREAIATGSTLPPLLLVQIEQQLMLAGASRCLFMASRWNDDDTLAEEVHCFVESDPELRKALLQGWTQLAIDRDAYVHVEKTVATSGRAPDSLPALLIEVTGMVTSSNLAEFKAHAMTVFDGIKTALVTDSDFADAEKTVKWCKEVEDRLEAAKSHALAQTASIDELFRVIDQIKEESRSKRLALDKLVKAEKTNRKAEIITQARQAIEDHVAKLNQRIGGNWMPAMSAAPFAEAVAGLKSLDSMRDKVSAALAQEKIKANEVADTIEANRKVMEHLCDPVMFPDFAAVCTKATDDFAALVAMRVSQDQQRKEAERVAAEAKTAAAVAAAVEAERMAEAKRVADEAARVTAEQATATINGGTQHGNDGQEQSERGSVASDNQPVGQSPEKRDAIHAASTPPIQADDEMIADFIRLLPISAVEKKALRENIVKWETYRIKVMAARGLAAAA